MAEGHRRYNSIYGKLVEDENDVFGAIAYALYKRQKIAYIEAYKGEHNGNEPDEAAFQSFHIATDTDFAATGFHNQAEMILDAFLQQVLAEQLEDMQEEFKQSTIIKASTDTEHNLRRDIESAKQLINSEISKVFSALSERKGIRGWIRDVSANIFVNVLTILLIGFLVVGSDAFDKISALVKQNIQNNPGLQPDTGKATNPSLPSQNK